MATTFPAVNGFHPSWVEMNISIQGEVTRLVKSIEYSNAKTRGMGRGPGTGKKKIRTRGTSEPEASIAFYALGFRDFRRKLAETGAALTPPRHWQDVEFDITVSYENPDGDIETDQIERCLVNEWSKSSEDDSEEPVVVECTLDVMDVRLDGDEVES
ncbi:MAG: hypothetical protein KF718_33285 [Polyangiaceae bacterium]|nr:hypothetical protein [Polyangiaceae bacterium]